MKFNFGSYEIEINIGSNKPLAQILRHVKNTMSTEDIKLKIPVIKVLRQLSKDKPELFESLGYDLGRSNSDNFYLGLKDAKEFTEKHMNFGTSQMRKL